MSTQLRELFERGGRVAATGTIWPRGRSPAHAVDAASATPLRGRSSPPLPSSSGSWWSARRSGSTVRRARTRSPGLPAQLPAADGLPPLVDGTMDAASAAYVVNGEVVVIDAATGDGAVVDFESMPLNFLGPMTGVTDRVAPGAVARRAVPRHRPRSTEVGGRQQAAVARRRQVGRDLSAGAADPGVGRCCPTTDGVVTGWRVLRLHLQLHRSRLHPAGR